jgi:hypothetical protein
MSCGTPYQKMGGRGGYSDQNLGNDIFLITVRVNGYTDESTAYEYFHRRAKEIQDDNNYVRYDVLEITSGGKNHIIYNNGLPYLVKKPSVYGRVKYYRD